MLAVITFVSVIVLAAGTITSGLQTTSAVHTTPTTTLLFSAATVGPPVPTGTPSPKHQPYNVSSYYLRSSNGSICAVLKTKLQFDISYKTNKTKGKFLVTFGNSSVWDDKTVVSGSCGTGNTTGNTTGNATSKNKTTIFVITYNDTYVATFTYQLDKQSKKWYQSDVSFTYKLIYAPNARNRTDLITVANHTTFQQKVGENYSLVCNSLQMLNLNDTNRHKVVMKLEDMQVQPFYYDEKFSNASICSPSPFPADNNSANNIILIASVSAIAALILIFVIVLISCICRKRNSHSGYEYV